MILFRRKYKKKITKVWGVISVLVIISMVILYAGFASTMFGGNPNAQDTDIGEVEVLTEDGLEMETSEVLEDEEEL